MRAVNTLGDPPWFDDYGFKILTISYCIPIGMFHGMDVPWFLMSVAGETHCKINGKK
jgi:hypothetical protein